MSQKINHWCVVCGKGYYACDSCDKNKSITPWRALTDTIEHFQLFTILRNYNNGLISKDEAKELLSSIDLSGREYFRESSRKTLRNILGDDLPSQPSKPKSTRKRRTSVVTYSTEEKVE